MYVYKQSDFHNHAYVEFYPTILRPAGSWRVLFMGVSTILTHQICKTSRASTAWAVNLAKTGHPLHPPPPSREKHVASCSPAQRFGVLCHGENRDFPALQEWACVF